MSSRKQTNDKAFQKELLKKLRSGKKNAYEDASIYTVLLDLVEGNGLRDVVDVLHMLANDLGEREYIESLFDKTKTHDWAKV